MIYQAKWSYFNILMGIIVGLLLPEFLTAQKSFITGTVLDSLAEKPLAGATIILKSQEGNIISSTTSSKQGEFSLESDRQNNGSIIFTYIQFAEKMISLSAYNKDGNLNLGKIYLRYNANALEQVIVQGIKPPVSMRFDRQVYKASEYNNAVGGNGVDVLRNLPAISVDASGSIAFRGSSNFLMLINGKVVQGNAATILAQIPTGSIENIEMITNPSAEYDAEGRSGIINVVTKNYRQDGWVMQATVMGGLPTINDYGNDRNARRYSGEVSAGFRKNKFDINASLHYLRNDIAGYREGNVFTIIDDHRTDFPSNGERSMERYNYGIRISSGYELNEKNTITAGFYYGKKFQIRDANLFYNNLRTDIANGTTSSFDYYNPNRQQKEGTFTLANLAFEHKFSKTSNITFTGLYESANLTSLTTNLNVLTTTNKDTLQYTRNPGTNPLEAWRLKVDYTQNGLSLGYQFRYDIQDGNFLYLTQILGTSGFEVDDEFTSSVKAENYVHAGYVQYKNIWKGLSYSAGLRLETTNRELNFSKDNETRTLSLVNLFPNAQLKYALPNKWNVKAGFSRRIRRTNNYELNPFPEREHSETLEQGDPDLLPELIGTIELGLEHIYPKGNFFFTPYFQTIKNSIQRTNRVYSDTILNRIFTNGEKATQLGLEISSTHAITNWWQSIAGFNIYYYKINGGLFDNTVQASNQAWAFTFNITQTFNLGKNWSSQLALNYLSDRPTLQGEDSYFLNPFASIKKSTADKRWTFQLLCQSIDWGWGTSNKQRILTYGPDFYTTTNYIYETNQTQLSLSYNLLKQNRKINLPVSEIGEKEF